MKFNTWYINDINTGLKMEQYGQNGLYGIRTFKIDINLVKNY